jgi:hypothetical protein
LGGPRVTNFCLIGDSLMFQADLTVATTPGYGVADITSKIAAAGLSTAATNLYIKAVGGKTITTADSTGTTTMQNIASARAQMGRVDVWLIALGTNNTSDTNTALAANVQTILDLIGTEGIIVWVGIGFAGSANTNALRMNPIIKTAVQAHAGSIWVDWNAYVHNGRDELNPIIWIRDLGLDSTHMTWPTGYQTVRNPFFVYCLQMARMQLVEKLSSGATNRLRVVEWDGTTLTDLGVQIFT